MRIKSILAAIASAFFPQTKPYIRVEDTLDEGMVRDLRRITGGKPVDPETATRYAGFLERHPTPTPPPRGSFQYGLRRY